MQHREVSAEPVTLDGRYVRLEPLGLQHHAALCAVGLDERIWRWNPVHVIRTPEDMRGYIDNALRVQATGTALPFATWYKAANQFVGSTRYANIDTRNRTLEIGSTWIAPPWQRTAVNTDAKYLMLQHAFETLGCIRVEFKTDSLNERSRAAIRRLGATEEGTFRNHMITPSGRIRHSAYYSIIDADWPAVKANLLSKLER
jgi:N-acetyltransferase